MNDDTMRDVGAAGDRSGAPLSPECETAVDARLADYLDDAPDPAVVAAVDAHVAGCPRCAALIGDLAGITAAARALPPLRPSRDLWAGIADRLATPVAAGGGATAQPVRVAPAVVSIDAAPSRRRRLALPARWRTLGAAAAALVLVTAGVTYTVTKAHDGRDAGVGRTSSAGEARPPTRGVIGGPPTPQSEVATSAGAAATEPRNSVAARGGSGTALVSGRGGIQFVPVGRTNKAAPASTKSAYDTQIETLRSIVRERRSQLDPSTLAVLERNIAIIDEAIAQSKAALRRDPRSRFLDDQLNDARDKKVELLRTAALLPART